jgi:hypothetical protein
MHEWPSPTLKDRFHQEDLMAKKRKRKYSPGVGQDVEKEMRRFNRGTARSGPGGRAGKVKSRKQAIAIALSEARKEGKRVPKKK